MQGVRVAVARGQYDLELRNGRVATSSNSALSILHPHSNQPAPDKESNTLRQSSTICSIPPSTKPNTILQTGTPAASALAILCKVSSINPKLSPFLTKVISGAPTRNTYTEDKSGLLTEGVNAFVELAAEKINNDVNNQLTGDQLNNLKTQLTTFYNKATVEQKIELYEKFYVELGVQTNSSSAITTTAPFHVMESTQEDRLTPALYQTGLTTVQANQTAAGLVNITSGAVLESIESILNGTATNSDIKTWQNTSKDVKLAIMTTISQNASMSNASNYDKTSYSQKLDADSTSWSAPFSTSIADLSSNAMEMVSSALTSLATWAGLTSADIMKSEISSPMKDLVAFNISKNNTDFVTTFAPFMHDGIGNSSNNTSYWTSSGMNPATDYVTTSAPFMHDGIGNSSNYSHYRPSSSMKPASGIGNSSYGITSISILSNIYEVTMDNQGDFNEGMTKIRNSIAALASLMHATNPYKEFDNSQLLEILKGEFAWAVRDNIFQYTAVNQALQNKITSLKQSTSHVSVAGQPSQTPPQTSSNQPVKGDPWQGVTTSKVLAVAAALTAAANATKNTPGAGNESGWGPEAIVGLVAGGLVLVGFPTGYALLKTRNQVANDHVAAQEQALLQLNEKAATPSNFNAAEWARLIKDAGYQTEVRELHVSQQGENGAEQVQAQAQNGAEQAQEFLTYLAQNQENLAEIITALDTAPHPAGNVAEATLVYHQQQQPVLEA